MFRGKQEEARQYEWFLSGKNAGSLERPPGFPSRFCAMFSKVHLATAFSRQGNYCPYQRIEFRFSPEPGLSDRRAYEQPSESNARLQQFRGPGRIGELRKESQDV